VLNKYARWLPFASTLSRGEFIPTRSLELLYMLRDHFPNHRLLLSDFYKLPDTIDKSVDAPVVQTRFQNQTVPCSTYMVRPGWFDIFFPTNFELLRDMYQLVCRADRPGRRLKVMTHKEFMSRFADVEQTQTSSKENVLLDFYENNKFFLS
jgi:hypothetical protein